MKDKDYRPIDCNYYDELVLLAMRKKSVEIIYKKESDKITIVSIIKDITTKDKIEYVILENDLKIRLDNLIKVDGKTVIL